RALLHAITERLPYFPARMGRRAAAAGIFAPDLVPHQRRPFRQSRIFVDFDFDREHSAREDQWGSARSSIYRAGKLFPFPQPRQMNVCSREERPVQLQILVEWLFAEK